MKKTILLVGTGGKKIGFGHLSRLKNIGIYFEHKGFKYEFLVNRDPSIQKILPEYNVTYFDLNQLNLLDYDQENYIIIVDSYIIPDFDLKNALYVRIDDNCHFSHYSADIIVNPNIAGENYFDCYMEKSSKQVKLLLGEKYVILHPFNYSVSPIMKKGKLAIFLGGSKIEGINQVLSILQFCEDSNLIKEIKLLVTKNYSDRIKNYKGEKIVVLTEMESIFNVIKDAEWGISSPGVTKYEFAALGIPTLLFALGENQIDAGIEFEKRGLGIYGGILSDINTEEIEKELLKLLSESRNLSEKLIEFKGSELLYDAIMSRYE